MKTTAFIVRYDGAKPWQEPLELRNPVQPNGPPLPEPEDFGFMALADDMGHVEDVPLELDDW